MNEPPVVEQMILCDEVRVHPGKLKKWDIIGLVFRFRSSKKERPIRMPRLSVFLRLANGRGEGEGRIVFVEYDTGRPCGASPRCRARAPQRSDRAGGPRPLRRRS